MKKIVELKNVNKTYNTGDTEFKALDNIDLSINKGEFVVILGPSGAGKSTLLKFITSMFYGTARTKNGKNISDFEKYKPWGKEEYSGKITYTLDKNKEYDRKLDERADKNNYRTM